jgi:hypothetical protein
MLVALLDGYRQERYQVHLVLELFLRVVVQGVMLVHQERVARQERERVVQTLVALEVLVLPEVQVVLPMPAGLRVIIPARYKQEVMQLEMFRPSVGLQEMHLQEVQVVRLLLVLLPRRYQEQQQQEV